ncbi:MAG: MFS transporter [Myxococcota bacterium]
MEHDSPAAPVSRQRLAIMGLLAMSIMMPVTLPVAILRELVGARFEVSEFYTSLFMSVNMIGALLAAPIAGALADRIGRRRSLIIGALFIDAGLFWAMTLSMPFGLFLIIRFFEGAAHIFSLSLLLSISASLGGSHARGRTMGITGAGMMLGIAIGAPLGGLIGSEEALRPLYLGSILLVGAALLASAVLPDPKSRDRRPELSEMIDLMKKNRDVIVPLIFAFADRFTVGFYTTTFSLFASGLHGASPPLVGLWISAFMLPFALLSFPFGLLADRFSKTVLLCGGSAIYGLLTASLGFWPTDFIGPGMALIGVFAAVMFVPSMLMTTDLTPPEIRGAALGAFNTAGSLGFILGPITGGLVSQLVSANHGAEIGHRAAFAVAGAAEILCALIALPFLLRLRGKGRTT